MEDNRRHHLAGDDDAARLIVEYLGEHPQAADTLEGIARWWVMGQRLSESTETVRRALDTLVAEGVIAPHRRPDGRIAYGLH